MFQCWFGVLVACGFCFESLSMIDVEDRSVHAIEQVSLQIQAGKRCQFCVDSFLTELHYKFSQDVLLMSVIVVQLGCWFGCACSLLICQ